MIFTLVNGYKGVFEFRFAKLRSRGCKSSIMGKGETARI